DVRDTVSVVLQLTLLLAVVALVITIVRRSFRKRHGTVIVPFDVNSPDGKYSGKAIADTIASELMRIQRMHSTELFKEWKLDNPQFGDRRKLAGVLPRRSKPVTMHRSSRRRTRVRGFLTSPSSWQGRSSRSRASCRASSTFGPVATLRSSSPQVYKFSASMSGSSHALTEQAHRLRVNPSAAPRA